MRLVDSSAWIEWLMDTPLAAQLEAELPKRSHCLVPTIVQFELYKWLCRERGEAVAEDFIAYTRDCNVVVLSTRVALLAADMARKHKLSATDAIIYATCLEHEADLLTCDAHFKDLSHVHYLEKG